MPPGRTPFMYDSEILVMFLGMLEDNWQLTDGVGMFWGLVI